VQYGTRHIIDVMNDQGVKIEQICMSGGLSKNSLYIQSHANITLLPIFLPCNEYSVLLGSAIYAKASVSEDLNACITQMSGGSRLIKPAIQTNELIEFHRNKYHVFREMLNDQLKYIKIMNV
jgi:ribulose kinase